MKFTAQEILAVSHLRASGFTPARAFEATGISIDSRSIQRGDLFFALRGSKYDGHNFLTKAIEGGAAAAIVEDRWVQKNEAFLLSVPVPYVVVEDSTKALAALALHHRKRFRIPVIAVGGSNGKTTTKEMIRAVLKTRYDVLATEGNLNNHLGVPLTLLRLEKKHKVAVVEIGTNHPGELRALCEMIEPTHGLITNIGREHLEFFKTLGGVARAEGELFDWLAENRPREGVFFLNVDDPHLIKRARRIKKTVSYGFKKTTAVIRGMSLHVDSRGAAGFRIKPRGKAAFDVSLGIPGLHNAINALAAAAVGLTLRVSASGIQRALASFTPAGKRMEVLSINGVTVLNDTYNSNPDSVKAALQTLRSIQTNGKKIAVLADMLELGAAAESLHRAVGQYVDTSKAEYLLTYGTLSRHTMEASNIKYKTHYDQKNVLAEYLAELLTPGDVVLVKGSRGMKMEDVVTFLQERLSKAA